MSLRPKRAIPECDYLLGRAIQEAEMADRAEKALADRPAQVHHRLASTYLDLLFGEDRQASERVDPEDRAAALLGAVATSYAPVEPLLDAGIRDLLDALHRLDLESTGDPVRGALH